MPRDEQVHRNATRWRSRLGVLHRFIYCQTRHKRSTRLEEQIVTCTEGWLPDPARSRPSNITQQ